jgi:hypothetical protein
VSTITRRLTLFDIHSPSYTYRYKQASKYTSFVAVHENEEAAEGTMQKRVVTAVPQATKTTSTTTTTKTTRALGGKNRRRGKASPVPLTEEKLGKMTKGQLRKRGIKRFDSADADAKEKKHKVVSASEKIQQAKQKIEKEEKERDREGERLREEKREKMKEKKKCVKGDSKKVAKHYFHCLAPVQQAQKSYHRAAEMDDNEALHDSWEDSRASPSPPSAPTSSKQLHRRYGESDFRELSYGQSAAGLWELNSLILALAGCTKESVREAFASAEEKERPSEKERNPQVKEKVWATVLAILIFRVKFKSLKDDWEMLVAKAEGWLQKQADGNESLVAWWFEKGATLVK